MLRISIIDEPHSTTLKLEGKVAHEWVAELRNTWSAISSGSQTRKRIVDLFGVSFVDGFGRALLEEMHAEGAKLVGSGPMISGLIEEIQGAENSNGNRGQMRRIILSMLVLLSLAFFATRLGAQTPALLTLEDAIRQAKSHNRKLRISKHDAESAKQDVAIAKTRRLPSVSTDIYGSGLLSEFSLEFERGAFGDFPSTGPIPDEDTKVTAERSFNVFATAQVTQPITQLYRLNLGIRAQEMNQKIALEETRKTEQEVVYEVRRAYYALLQTRSASAANRAAIASLKELHRVLRDRLLQESALPADELEVKVALASAEQQQAVLDNQYATQQEQLNLLIGRDPSESFAIEPVPALRNEEEDLAAARARASLQRPELRQSELRIKAADYDRRAKKAERLPELGAFVSYYSPFNVDIVPKNIAAAGVQLTWEPFDWGRKKRELNQKELAVQQAALAAEQSRDAVQIEVNRAHRSLKEARLSAEVAHLNSQAVSERLRVVTNQFEQKAALLKDVLDMQKKLAEAQHQQQQSLLAFWNAKAEFAKAIGDE
jgi:outer membrane protein